MTAPEWALQSALVQALGADAGVLTDDYYLHVRMGELARELDFPGYRLTFELTTLQRCPAGLATERRVRRHSSMDRSRAARRAFAMDCFTAD